MPCTIQPVLYGGDIMQDMTNNEIIELLINISERYDSYSVEELISSLEADREFMKTK